MNAAETIRLAVAEVAQLRRESAAVPALAQAVGAVKRFQSRRFAGTHADLLTSPTYRAAAGFFLDELYSDRDYVERDAQFARIAGAVEKLFPRDVAATAAGLAGLHALTESLDHGLAGTGAIAGPDDIGGYVRAWRLLGRREDRQRQLELVVGLGTELAHLTRTPGLRLMLKMMRGAATAAGLGTLQRFLEGGFDTGGAERFLQVLRQREQHLVDLLFDADTVATEAELARMLGEAR
jgi:hypothetical protein